MAVVFAVVRVLVAAAAAWAGVVALTHWAVRRGHLAPFGPLARGVRAASDPMLRPIERRLVRQGGNPQQAPLWLFLGTVVGGLVLLALLQWLVGAIWRMGWALQGGPRAMAALAINAVATVLILALVVRVVGSWFGMGRFGRFTRPAWLLTDWLVHPIQRLLPPTGMLDFSPLVAWLVLILLRRLLIGLVL